MDVTIIGTGNMARGLGRRLIAGGHNVTVLGRRAEDAEAVVGDIGGGQAGRTGDAIADDVVMLAVYYPDAQAAVEQYGDGLSGKVIIDITNPVNESFDGLVTPPDGSAAQELARSAAGARLVKAFNTTFASTLIAGDVDGTPLDVFIAGDDEDARKQVAELVASGGLNPVDAGPLEWARALEGFQLLHMALQLRDSGLAWGSTIKIVVP